MTAGAPTKYDKKYNEQVKKLCLLGATDKEMADFFNVTEATINNWKKDYPEFFDSIKEGREVADATVADSLYKRANGYEHPEDQIFNDKGVPLIVPTIKHYPPDSTAAIFWLKNRRSVNWRDKTEVENTHIIPQEIRIKSTKQMAEEKNKNGQSSNRDCVKSD
jgi:hypothetical protein